MLSGNGRHRRPRQAPALLVAAGVTGSAIAIPLMGASAANAADGTTWDKVAECESGGSWSANTGNGYYGGLQISQDDWDNHGGLEYASSPEEASRSQQIAVAEKILADLGTKPWATCALLSGLTSNSGSVDVDTGVGDSGSSDSGNSSHSTGSSGSSGSSESSGSKGSAPSGNSADSSNSASGSSGSSDSGPSSEPSPSPGSSKGTGAADSSSGSGKPDKSTSSGSGNSQGASGSSASTPEVDDSDNSWQTGGSWSLVDTGAISGGRHRGGSAEENVTKSQTAPSSGRHAARDYTVHAGDTLASIADSLDLEGGWRALYSANKDAIGTDPNNIAPGQTLELSAENG
ncbi:transglycosylase family protein [Streptomyces sp. NPDC001843]|uniref:transglycosylase family protein n=1 Tax=Streptomyces sp. NPDC001843 TaxID=3364617 RepID=UPI00367B652D